MFKRTKGECGTQTMKHETPAKCDSVRDIGVQHDCRDVKVIDVVEVDVGFVSSSRVVQLFEAAHAEAGRELARIAQARAILDSTEGAIRKAMCEVNAACKLTDR
jgi:hypothetical protein